MSGTSSDAYSSAAEGRRALDAILDDLEAAAANGANETFYELLFERLTTLGACHIAVWRMDEQRRVHVERSSGDDGAFAADMVAPIVAAGEPQRLGSEGRTIIVPWRMAARPEGALLVEFNETLRAAVIAGWMSFLSAVGGIVGAFRERRDHIRLRERWERQAKIEAFAFRLYETSDAAEVAYRLANDGRVLVGCDRVAVVLREGRRFRVRAVSGAEHVHRRSESIQQLQVLCERVAVLRQPLWWNGSREQYPPQVERSLGEYLDLSPATALAVVPLTEANEEIAGEKSVEPNVFGMLVFEQYARQFEPETKELIEALPVYCRPALKNALHWEFVPGHTLWFALARDSRWSPYISRTGVALGVAFLLAAILGLIPAEVRIKARGELQPVERREVFAPRDGVVTAVHVDHGDHVAVGTTLLELRSPELELEVQRALGELETARKQLAAAQSEQLAIRPGDAEQRVRQRRLTAEAQQLEEQIRGLEQRQLLLQEQQAALLVKSPLTGGVITWNARERLATRPLRRGDALLTIADERGPWQLELRIPSRSAGRVLAASATKSAPQNVRFVLTTSPGLSLTGVVRRIGERVETDDSGESFLPVTVDIPIDRVPNPVPGAAVVARIHCGRGSLAAAWFHEFWDAARLWLAF